MKTSSTVEVDDFPSLLDRLVCGELDETARGRVLAWLEQDPSRWRVCGLAFLEAQTWSQALGDASVGTVAPVLPASAAASRASQTAGTGRRGIVRRILTVAALLVAFGLGLALRDVVLASRPPAERPVAGNTASDDQAPNPKGNSRPDAGGTEPVLASLDVQAGGRFGPTAPLRIPVVPAAFDAGARGAEERLGDIPDYLRRQWERRGFKVSLERRFLLARLPDGQQVVVPVDQLHVDQIPVSIN